MSAPAPIRVNRPPVLTLWAAVVAERLGHPHAAARRMVEEVGHPTAGTLRLLGRPIKFPGAEAPPLRRPPLRPPPRLGEDGDAVLREVLGLDEAEVARLRGTGVLGGRSDAGASERRGGPT